MKIWKSPAGELKLKRFPFAGDKSHQAWDAADERILSHFGTAADTTDAQGAGGIVVCGEAFGVLATAWGSGSLTVVSDSVLSLLALEENRRLNPDRCRGELRIRTTTTGSAASHTPTGSPVKAVFIRLPKSLELLEVYLNICLEYSDSDAEIWLGGMDRRWSRGVKKLTDRMLEPLEIFPFERHARWIKYRPAAPATAAPAATDAAAADTAAPHKIAGLLIQPSTAVFSADSLDPGTSAFLKAFPADAAAGALTIADLGCGSGILGLTAALAAPDARLIFSDESFLAVAAAQVNAELNGVSARCSFTAENGLCGTAGSSVDLVLCNPPFHYKNIQTLEPALFMFSEAARVLKPGGTLQIVGNSHLGYHKHLLKYFENVNQVYKNDRFTVLRARFEG